MAQVSSAPPPAAPPPLTSQVTFLYFKDIDRAAAFYGDTLGLKKTHDLGWVRIFATSPTSSVGLVNATGGSLRPGDDKPVMVSMVVATPADVDRWHTYLVARGVTVTPPADSAKVNVRALSLKDPEGYSLEIFAWR